MSERASTRGYAEQATMLIARYESIVPEEVHEKVLHLFPEGPCRTLDIGAGSGRDAAWFAAKGHTVVAVEPTAEMREAGMRLHPDPNIEWVDDDLPDLAALADDAPFDLITLTAVWQHLDADERKQGMARLAALARRDAVVALLLRHGPVPEGRRMFQVTAEETAALAAAAGFAVLVNTPRRAIRGDAPADVTWTAFAFRRL
ncbi:MAG TPA: class I SAM-dependent methyltransferase [Candidatus Binatia bacterium]|nr:class I SAM-dependent methyltransferase [Candidatus Binatia bacterium]